MSVPPVLATNVCAHCGALSQTNEGKCWLCYENKSEPNPFAVSGKLITSEPPQSQMTTWDVVFSVLLGLCALLSLLIGIGLAVEDKGLLIPFAIFIGPAYAVTIFRGTVSIPSKGNTLPCESFCYICCVSIGNISSLDSIDRSGCDLALLDVHWGFQHGEVICTKSLFAYTKALHDN